MTSATAPRSDASLTQRGDLPTREYAGFFRDLATAFNLAANLPQDIQALTVRVDALEEETGAQIGNVVGDSSVVTDGVLQGGVVTVHLLNDVDTAPALSFYGAITEGVKGWRTYSDNFAALDNGDGTSSLDLVDLTDSGTGAALVKVTRDGKGRISGTEAATTTDLTEGTNLYFTAARVRATVLAGLSLVASAAIAATDTVLGALGKLQAQITDNLLPAGYIDGNQMVYVGPNALTVTSGAAYIPGLGKVLRATSDITKTGLSLLASTWYHIYRYSNAGTPDVEIVTTAPAAAYSGTARTKTGDMSRRYVGSIKTDASGLLYPIRHDSDARIYFITGIDTFKVLVGNATTTTSVSCASFVPLTGKRAFANIINNDTTHVAWLGNSDAIPSPSNYMELIGTSAGGTTLVTEVVLDSSQAFQYLMAGGAVANLVVRLKGYIYER